MEKEQLITTFKSVNTTLMPGCVAKSKLNRVLDLMNQIISDANASNFYDSNYVFQYVNQTMTSLKNQMLDYSLNINNSLNRIVSKLETIEDSDSE